MKSLRKILISSVVLTGIILSPAIGAALMSISTVIVAINSRFLKVIK
jgi:cation transport ATPase